MTAIYPAIRPAIGPAITSTFEPRGTDPVIAAIRALFSSGEQGAWYDPSDMSTLFQDSAGTTPVTAVEQPVGRILDKSGRGNHATQATTTKRPVYSRRVNLVSSTNVSTWEITGCTVTNLGPSGFGADAFEISGAADANANVYSPLAQTLPTKSTIYCKLKAGTNTECYVDFYRNSGGVSIALSAEILDHPTATVTLTSNTVRITGLTNEWATLKASFEQPSGGIPVVYIKPWISPVTSVVKSVIVTCPHVQYEGAPYHGFQSVTSPTNYDADPAKFPAYLRFDGVDDDLQTGNIDFTSTDKMTVWAGVTAMDMARSSGNVNQLLYSNGDNFNGFGMRTPHNSGAISFASNGSTGVSEPTEQSLGSQPRSMVLCGAGDQSAPFAVLRRDGLERSRRTDAQGASGGYGNRAMRIGSGGGFRFFNGNLYGLIVRGAQSSLTQIEAAEKYMRGKMRL